MKKSLKIIGIVMIIIVILGVLVSIWVEDLKKDQEKTKETMKIVQASYNDFNNRVEEFSNIRNKFYEYKDGLYLETLGKNSDEWNNFIKEYADIITEIDSKAKNLKKNCDVKYGDVDTNNKCTQFKANYEAANNYYISDIVLYNELVDEYNKWNEENGGKYAEVKKGTFPVYKDYIDYDKDGEYFGKEEA